MANIRRIEMAIQVMKRVERGVKKGTHRFDLGTWSEAADDYGSDAYDPDKMDALYNKLSITPKNSQEYVKLSLKIFKAEHGIKATEKSYKECGTAACFSGWLAVSPEALAEGACASSDGDLVYSGFGARDGIAKFLDITVEEAYELVSPSGYACASSDVAITPADVLDKLYALLEKYDG
jgi:hypothetical protein